jgi:hypothetical protein
MLNDAKSGSEVHHGHISKVERYKWLVLDKPGVFKRVDKNELHIDHRYQRDANLAKVTEIASEFSWPAFGVLIVTNRADKLYVVDGQHRFLGSMKRSDVTTVPCMIFESQGLPFEAKTFLDAQTKRKPVTAVAKYKALLVSKDPIALGVDKLVRASGRKVSNSPSANTICCIALLLKTQATSPEILAKLWPLVLKICKNTTIADKMIGALVWVEKWMPEGQSLTDRKWSEKLMKAGAEGIIRQIHKAMSYYVASGQAVWGRGVVELLNHKLRDENRLSMPGDK